MNRHEGIMCNGCGKVSFTGRCYRCLICSDFDICAECYENDFTTAEHPFDHPVKCVYTLADVELYFGAEYISSDPPQSYRCPYCKQWGFNESTFLEHVSSMHTNASPLLVSTMVTLFEQQQASRLFLEDEQLAAFSANANSRNALMNRSRITLDLYLEPLNPDGSYRNRRSQETCPHAATHKNEGRRGAAQQNAAIVHGPVQPPQIQIGSTELSVAPLGGSLGSGGGQYVNFAEPLNPRRRGRPRAGERIRFNVPPIDNLRFTISEAERNRLNFMIPPAELNAQSSYNQQHHQQQHHHHHHRHRHHHHHHHPYQMPQSGSSSSTTAQQSINGGHPTLNDMMRFYQNHIIPLPLPLPSGSSRPSPTPDSLLREPRPRQGGLIRVSGPHGSLIHVSGGRGLGSGGGGAATGSANSAGSSQRQSNGNDNNNAGAALRLPMRPHDDEGSRTQSDEERQRFLCYRFRTLEITTDQNIFLVQRAEFVAQLFASALSDEQLQFNVHNEENSMTTTPNIITNPIAAPKLRRTRLNGESVGAGDAEPQLSPR
ncbi:uncharacterized protein [Drosophila tropicalis]|uniref:uncharacterized protein n=1 Tax=Drosophila tropicalis TaxID=46794 RepID=UPI0035AB99FF